MRRSAHTLALGAEASALRFSAIGTFVLVGALACGGASALAGTTSRALGTTVDGMHLDVPSVVRSGVVYVPVRSVFERLRSEVAYTPPGSVAVHQNGVDLADVRVGTRASKVKGTARTLVAAPFMMNGRVMVPLDLVRTTSAGRAVYVRSTQSVRIAAVAAAAMVATADPLSTPAPTATATDAPAAAMSEERHGIPWWVWLLLLLALLGIIAALMRRKKEPIITTTGKGPDEPKIQTRR